MVRGVRALGMEACVTLGMLTEPQAERLKEAGLPPITTTSTPAPTIIRKIVSTRTYDEGPRPCRPCETPASKCVAAASSGWVKACATARPCSPCLRRSIRIRKAYRSMRLAAIHGTPLAGRKKVDPLEFVRMIATARIVMPRSVVRLSAGRGSLSREAQILGHGRRRQFALLRRNLVDHAERSRARR